MEQISDAIKAELDAIKDSTKIELENSEWEAGQSKRDFIRLAALLPGKAKNRAKKMLDGFKFGTIDSRGNIFTYYENHNLALRKILERFFGEQNGNPDFVAIHKIIPENNWTNKHPHSIYILIREAGCNIFYDDKEVVKKFKIDGGMNFYLNYKSKESSVELKVKSEIYKKIFNRFLRLSLNSIIPTDFIYGIFNDLASQKFENPFNDYNIVSYKLLENGEKQIIKTERVIFSIDKKPLQR